MKFPKKWPHRVHRWFLSLAAMILAGSAVMAQNATPSPGPVHIPAGAVTNAPAVSPALSPSFASAVSSAPVAPSVATSTDTGDIRDIRGPISIPYEWLWAAYLAAGFLVAMALYGAWRWYRAHARLKARLPFDIALDRLEAARTLLKENKVREYAFTVSEIIRVYIEQRFGEKAARRTTEEFLSDLLRQTDTPLAPHRDRLEDFLNYCDLMKFARWEASPRDLEAMHASAREFVLETRPQPESAKAPPTAQPQLAHVK